MSKAIIAAIDKELARLEEVRRLLIQKEKNSKAGKGSRSAAPKKSGKRKLSAEARARITEAQRKRWAAASKARKAKQR